MKYPLISVVIATYNSENNLPKVLKSIQKQTYPQKKIETLIIDGGSSDSTIAIAKKHKCKVLHNKNVNFVYAKFMGYRFSKGKYIVFLDSDEILLNKNSFKQKLAAMIANKKNRVVLSSGYESPVNSSKINIYVNDYGDPFSLFVYKSPRRNVFFLDYLKRKYKTIEENESFTIFDFTRVSDLPFIEMISMNVMIDLNYVKNNFPQILRKSSIHNHIFYLLNSKNNFVAIMKKDPIMHYSVVNFSKYLKKISSRVKNNIFGNEMGSAGFSGRERYYSNWFKLKKILFIPYSFSIILPIIDSIYLLIRRKDPIYLLHPILCLYTSFQIVYFCLLKISGGNADHLIYGR